MPSSGLRRVYVAVTAIAELLATAKVGRAQELSVDVRVLPQMSMAILLS